MEKKAHIHCIICSRPLSYNESFKTIRTYICKECMNTFPLDYINFRIDCHDKGLWSKDFEILEHRLTFGATKEIDTLDLPNSCYMKIEYKKDGEVPKW